MNSQLFIPYQQSVDRYTLKMPPWADPDMKAKTSAIRKARWAARTSEERAAIMAKAWATRKAKMQ